MDIFTVAWRVKYADAAPRASTVVVDEVEIPLIGIDDLIHTKQTGHPLDAADVEALEEIKLIRQLSASGVRRPNSSQRTADER